MQRRSHGVHSIEVRLTEEEMRVLGGLARLRGKSAGAFVREALGLPALPGAPGPRTAARDPASLAARRLSGAEPRLLAPVPASEERT